MINHKLAIQLLKMSRADQEMRNNATQDISLWDSRLDIRHTRILKSIVKKHGWPAKSLVGDEASQAAWLLVQHADHDVSFQEECLQLLKQQPLGEVRLANIAYLEDRIRCAKNLPQLYGTQFDNQGRRFGPKSVEDRKHLDTRRRAMGLSTFKEYRRLMAEHYGKNLS